MLDYYLMEIHNLPKIISFACRYRSYERFKKIKKIIEQGRIFWNVYQKLK